MRKGELLVEGQYVLGNCDWSFHALTSAITRVEVVELAVPPDAGKPVVAVKLLSDHGTHRRGDVVRVRCEHLIATGEDLDVMRARRSELEEVIAAETDRLTRALGRRLTAGDLAVGPSEIDFSLWADEHGRPRDAFLVADVAADLLHVDGPRPLLQVRQEPDRQIADALERTLAAIERHGDVKAVGIPVDDERVRMLCKLDYATTFQGLLDEAENRAGSASDDEPGASLLLN